MVASGLGASWLAFVLGLGGGLGLPLGLPPMPEDPAIVNVAPEECLGYVASAGVAAFDANGVAGNPGSTNETEKLLAEPEVGQLAAALEGLLRHAMTQNQRGLPPGVTSNDVADLVKLLLIRPAAVYVSTWGLQSIPMGDREIRTIDPSKIRAGMIVNVGDDVAKTKAKIDALAKALPQGMVNEVEIGGEKYTQFAPAPVLTATWGFHGKYFLFGLGEDEIKTMLKRVQGAPPKWLAQLREQLPVERRSSVTYLNLKGIMAVALPTVGPKVPELAKALGFGNVTSLASVIGLDQKGCVSRTLLSIEGEPEGLLRLVNVQPLTAADLAPVPQDATFALAFKLSPEATFGTILDVAGKLNPHLKDQLLQTIGRHEESTGFKLRDDFLKPFGDTWCAFDSPSEGGLLSGLTLVVSLKDPAHAAEVHAKLLKVWRSHLHEARRETAPVPPRLETASFMGKEIHTLRSASKRLMASPSWCMTDRQLIVSLFPQGIKAYLARSGEFRSLDQRPEVAQVFQGDSGPLKIAYCDTQRVFDVLYPAALAAASTIDKQWDHLGLGLNAASWPSAGSIRRHLIPSVVSVRRTKAGIETVGRYTLPTPVLAPAATLVGLATHARANAVRSAAAMSAPMASRAASPEAIETMNNMKQIGLAIHNYAQAHRTFPPAYTANKDGKALLSWRVLILPYIEQDALYKEFHLDEPWDSEHNKTLIARMPPIYRSPTSTLKRPQGKANYLTARGDNTVFPGSKPIGFQNIVDGTSNTIMTVEVSDAKAVEWTKPDDFAYDEKEPTKGLAIQSGRFTAGLCDGSVRQFPAAIKPQTLKNLFLCNDRQVIDWNEIPR